MRTETTQRSLDEIETDVVVATLFESEGPPRGVTGLVDWRLNGFVSRLILNEAVSGKYEEMVLLPLQQRLPARRMLLVGLGKKENFNLTQARHLAYKLGKTLNNLQTIDVVMSFPNAVDENISGQTQQSVMDGLVQAGLPSGLSVRWLAQVPK